MSRQQTCDACGSQIALIPTNIKQTTNRFDDTRHTATIALSCDCTTLEAFPITFAANVPHWWMENNE